ncbi:hypothetical protein B5M09_003020 [Aphanomyces astaci]|uniref:Uncharacterized protein n=2 Tax=Aphanomyces astaci TaxID=112090 RepID=A0A425DBF7_APHAT|nr:hypothetical protein B5M09_003020 [Aphanomyces astaci]
MSKCRQNPAMHHIRRVVAVRSFCSRTAPHATNTAAHDVMDRFEKHPRHSTALPLSDAAAPPTTHQLQSMFLSLVNDGLKDEAAQVVQYATDKAIDIDYDLLFHRSIKDSKLNLHAFAHVMIAHPIAFSTQLRLHALRGCLGAKNYSAAIELFNHVEHDHPSSRMAELNKPLLSLLRQLSRATPPRTGLRNAQYLLTDFIMFRNAAGTSVATLLDALRTCHPDVVAGAVKLVVYSLFAVPKAQWHHQLDRVLEVLQYCIQHRVALPDTWCFTTAFLKSKQVPIECAGNERILQFAVLYVAMAHAELVVPSMEPTWLAIQAAADTDDNLTRQCLRLLCVTNMTRYMFHFGLNWACNRGDVALASELCRSVVQRNHPTPTPTTLKLVTPLLPRLPSETHHDIVAYLKRHIISLSDQAP